MNWQKQSIQQGREMTKTNSDSALAKELFVKRYTEIEHIEEKLKFPIGQLGNSCLSGLYWVYKNFLQCTISFFTTCFVRMVGNEGGLYIYILYIYVYILH